MKKQQHKNKKAPNKQKQYLDRFNFRMLTVLLACSSLFDCLSTHIPIFGDDSRCAKSEMVLLIAETCREVSDALAQFPLAEEDLKKKRKRHVD